MYTFNPKGWGRCKTCLYRNTVEYNRVNNCDYILITGHKRPSPGGLECTAYIKDTTKRRRKPRDPWSIKKEVDE